MNQPVSDSHSVDVGRYIVRSIYGMFVLLEPPDKSILKTQMVDLATLAWRLKCEWAPWVLDDGVHSKRLLWLGCPRGDDIQLFEARMYDVIGHFKITTHAAITLTEDCVSVSLHQNGENRFWFSAGTLITDEW